MAMTKDPLALDLNGHRIKYNAMAMEPEDEPMAERSEISDAMDTEGPDDNDDTDDCEEREISRSVAEDITKFKASFRELSKRYRLIDRIGEGK